LHRHHRINARARQCATRARATKFVSDFHSPLTSSQGKKFFSFCFYKRLSTVRIDQICANHPPTDSRARGTEMSFVLANVPTDFVRVGSFRGTGVQRAGD
jgi:hypothetical protein